MMQVQQVQDDLSVDSSFLTYMFQDEAIEDDTSTRQETSTTTNAFSVNKSVTDQAKISRALLTLFPTTQDDIYLRPVVVTKDSFTFAMMTGHQSLINSIIWDRIVIPMTGHVDTSIPQDPIVIPISGI
jgi:hypothetical protein